MDERARRVFRTFMVGSAVAASLATLEAANDPVMAAILPTATPSSAVTGSSPTVTLNWTTAFTPNANITVNIGSFTTNASTNCASSAITLKIGGNPVLVNNCVWDAVTNTFTLTPATLGVTRLSFPAGVLTAGAAGATQMLLSDDGGAPTATNTITVTSASAPYPPDWFQSYQRGSVVENCAPTWNPSWAMWANNGTGGFVCVRTNYYDPGLAAWSYR
jgi:hypothetical protein